MVIDYSLTEDDFFNFTFYAGWASPEKKTYRIWYYIKFVGYAFIGAFFMILIDKNQQPNYLSTFCNSNSYRAGIWLLPHRSNI